MIRLKNIRKLGSRSLAQTMSYAKQVYWEAEYLIHNFSRMLKWNKFSKKKKKLWHNRTSQQEPTKQCCIWGTQDLSRVQGPCTCNLGTNHSPSVWGELDLQDPKLQPPRIQVPGQLLTLPGMYLALERGWVPSQFFRTAGKA